MGKFDGILIISDIDGTLTGYGGKISEATARAVEYFKNEGGLFSLATGRTPEYIKENLNQIKPNTFIVCHNGGSVYNPIEEKYVKYNFIGKRGRDVVSYVKKAYPNDMLTIHKTLGGQTMKIVFVQPSPELSIAKKEDLISRFGNEFDIVRSWDRGVELLSKCGGKGNGLKDILKYEKREIKLTIGIGDYENDIPLLRAADVSYAPSNAIDEAKRAATHVTVSSDDDVFCHILNDISPC